MSVTQRMILVMAVIGVFSSLFLAASYSVTKPFIEKNKLEELQRSILIVLPDAKTYEDISTADLEVYKGLDAQNNPVGYAFIAQGPGFQGNIKMMVGVTQDVTKIYGMRVLEQVETPGLGGDIAGTRTLSSGKTFQEQFSALKLPGVNMLDAAKPESFNIISYIKNMPPQRDGEIEAITGATISSKAVVRILNQSIAKLAQQVQ